MAGKIATFFRILTAGLIALHFGAAYGAAGKKALSSGCPCDGFGSAVAPVAPFSVRPQILPAVPHGVSAGGMFPAGIGARGPTIGPVPSPPPGTLGWTYRRPTRLIPEDEHPRVGMLEVCIPPEVTAAHIVHPNEQLKVTVRGLDEGYLGDDGLWHFKAEELIPGVPHIYDVKFELVRIDRFIETRYGRPVQRERETKLRTLGYRTVRLIPGRIVELTY